MGDTKTSKTTSKVVKKVEKQPKIEVDYPTLQNLLEAGSHFGHKTSRWNPKMEKYIFDSRNGIHVLDLTKTMKLLEEAVDFLIKSSQKGNILLVGTKGQAATLIKTAGNDFGAFYVSRRWPGGLLTNFKTVRKSVKKMIEMEENLAQMKGYETKREKVVLERDKNRLENMYEGLRFMDKMPSALVIIDTKIEKNAIREASRTGIPIIGLVDTNCDPSLVDYPIPANDDSIKSIKLFVDVLVQGFASSQHSAKLVGLRNDHFAKLARMKEIAEQEQERIRKEQELEVQKLKAMREGKKIQAKSDQGKVVRIVRQEQTEPAKETPKPAVKAKKEDKVKKSKPAAKTPKTTKAKPKSEGTGLDSLGSRTKNALEAAGIKKLTELKGKTKDDLKEIKGIGDKAADEILKALK